MKHFIARQSKPSKMLSDNATHFHLATKGLNRIWDEMMKDPSVTNYCAQENISWEFMTALAPWKGGIYKRMMSLIKSSFHRTVHPRKQLEFQEIVTLITEIEAVINSRPLTYLYSEPETKVLRPCDFLTPLGATGTPHLELNLEDPDWMKNLSSTEQLVELYKVGQIHLNLFWTLWKTEPHQPERTISNNPPTTQKSLKSYSKSWQTLSNCR